MLLFTDTETTGFVDLKKPPSDPKQPYVVQLAAILTTDEGETIDELDMIVKPEGWEVPVEASNVHGITTEIALSKGLHKGLVLNAYIALHDKAYITVAHNADFDRMVMKAFIFRCGSTTLLKPMHCTMRMCRDIIKIPPTPKMRAAGYMQYKNPSLTESYKFFFHKNFEGAHNALNDVRATKEVYFAAKKRLGD